MILKTNSFFQAFFGRFSATVTNSSWRNLEFYKKKSLSFSENSLSFSENSLNFSNFKLCLVEKLKFGQIFVQYISTSRLF